MHGPRPSKTQTCKHSSKPPETEVDMDYATCSADGETVRRSKRAEAPVACFSRQRHNFYGRQLTRSVDAFQRHANV